MSKKIVLLRMTMREDEKPVDRFNDLGPHLMRLFARISPDFMEIGPRSDKLTMQSYFISTLIDSQAVANEIRALPHASVGDQILVLELGEDHGEVRQNALLLRLRD